MELLEENIPSTKQDTGVGEDFLNRTPFAQELRPAIDKQLAS